MVEFWGIAQIEPPQEALEAAGVQVTALPSPTPTPVPSVAYTAPAAPTSGSYRDLGYQMAVARGWGGSWAIIDALITSESDWRTDAQNPLSTACGIAQNISGCSAYPDPSPAGQIQWAYDYIAQRYGTPEGAWAHKCATSQNGVCGRGWY